MANFPGPGKLVPLGVIRSRWVSPRSVTVWLPPDYENHRQLDWDRYGVLYMHDGQNLFESDKSFTGVDWGVPATLAHLIRERLVPPTIVVGVGNTGLRMSEYMPAQALEFIDRHPQGRDILSSVAHPGLSEGYLRFLVEELKPLIDSRFYTRPQARHTSTMGSSMGGLISLNAVCQYPEVFGAAGCLSTHWPAGDGAVLDYLDRALPRVGNHRFYFDYGTETADAPYEPYQRGADQIMQKHGYRARTDYLTLKFPGEEHSERAWRARLHLPLRFVLAGTH